MAGEFKIKTGLLLGAAPTQAVTSITDSSSFTNDSSTLATVKAIKKYSESNFVPVTGGTFTNDVSIVGNLNLSNLLRSLDQLNFLGLKTNYDYHIDSLILYSEQDTGIYAIHDILLQPLTSGKIMLGSDVSAFGTITYASPYVYDSPLDLPDVSFLNSQITSNNYWTSYSDPSVVMLADPSNNLVLSSIEIEKDAGNMVFINMPIEDATLNTEQSYEFDIDSSTIFKAFALADGLGSISESAFAVEANYFCMGDPKTDGTWRFIVDTSGNLSVQKRISGSWVERGNFY